MGSVSGASVTSTQDVSELFAAARVIRFDPVKIGSRNGAGRFKEIAFEIKADMDLCTLEEKDIAAQVRKQARKAGVAMRRFSASPYAKRFLSIIRKEYELKEIGPYCLTIGNSRGRYFKGASALRIEVSLNSDVAGKPLLALSKSDIKRQILSQIEVHGGTMSDRRLSSVADSLYRRVRIESAALRRAGIASHIVTELEERGLVAAVTGTKDGEPIVAPFSFLDVTLEEALHFTDEQLQDMVRRDVMANAEGLRFEENSIRDAAKTLSAKLAVYRRWHGLNANRSSRG